MDADKNTASLEKLPKAGAKRLWVRQYDDLENQQQDWVAQEVPVALVYNGIAHVVMMATPKAVPEFAMGFSLAEGIISSPQEIYGMDVVSVDNGIEVHVELATRRFSELKERRRSMAGRTGCGVCGTEQLAEVLRPIPTLPFTQRFDLASLDKALPQLRDVQAVGQLTGCTHAAGWIDTQGTMLGGYEDIGRHVALDKLLGARSTRNWRNGAVLVSSRASYEMVQKSAMCGVEILFAVSAATTLAIEVAQRCNLTLVGFSKPGRATVYSHPERVMP